MSDTPRTDAITPHTNLSHEEMRSAAWKLRNHARQLERELATLEAKHKELRELAKRIFEPPYYGAALKALRAAIGEE